MELSMVAPNSTVRPCTKDPSLVVSMIPVQDSAFCAASVTDMTAARRVRVFVLLRILCSLKSPVVWRCGSCGASGNGFAPNG